MTKLIYTPEDESIALDIIKKYGPTKLAKKDGTTLANVLGYMRRKGIEYKQEERFFHLYSDKLPRIKKLLNENIPLKTICRKVEIPYHHLKPLLERLHIEHKTQFDIWENQRNNISKNIERLYHEHINNKKSLYEIAHVHDISVEQLKSSLKIHELIPRVASYNVSRGETEIYEYVNNILKSNQSHRLKISDSDKKWIQIDVYCPEKSFGIEYCGEYWHSAEAGTDRNYHQKKNQLCKDCGIKLMTIFEHEWRDKRELIKAMIRARINSGIKNIYARKCICKEITAAEAKQFHQDNHINGYVNSSKNIGLFFENNLISVVSFSKSRFDKNHEYEITRYSTIRDHRVIGGFSKMFAFSEIRSCMTYADLRFGEGKVYEKAGFSLVGTTPPNYWYFNRSSKTAKFESRMKYQKRKIKHLVENGDNKTEFQIMTELGFYRIYDCGSHKYSLNK